MEDFSSAIIFVLIAVISLVSKLFNKKEEIEEEIELPEFFPSEEKEVKSSDVISLEPQPKRESSRTTPRTTIKRAQIKEEKPSPIPNEGEKENDFSIHSAEEARRAIIWGEILQRKYT